MPFVSKLFPPVCNPRKQMFLRLIFCAVTAGLLCGQPVGLLKVRVIDGDGSFNDIRNEIGHEITIEVRDQNNQPLQGVEVTLTAPSTGPSGLFANGTLTEVVTTNRDGLAHSAGMKPNATEGRLTVTVVARSEGHEGTATIGQSNTAAGRIAVDSKKKKDKKNNKKPGFVSDSASLTDQQ